MFVWDAQNMLSSSSVISSIFLSLETQYFPIQLISKIMMPRFPLTYSSCYLKSELSYTCEEQKRPLAMTITSHFFLSLTNRQNFCHKSVFSTQLHKGNEAKDLRFYIQESFVLSLVKQPCYSVCILYPVHKISRRDSHTLALNLI